MLCFRGLCDSVAAAEGEATPPGEMEQEDEKEMTAVVKELNVWTVEDQRFPGIL